VLETFVLKSQVSDMPGDIFLEFVEYECGKKADTIVEKIIMQNKQPYDDAKLSALLQAKERNYLQLLFFSRAVICEVPDFFTPFIKVFSSFKKYSEKLERGFNSC
jgi:hypothetical protein